MHNDLFKIGPFVIHGYGLMIAIGIIAAVLMADYRGKKRNLNSEFIFDLGIFSLVGGLLGARLLFCIVEFRSMLADPSLFWNVTSGLVVYGGIIGGILAGLLFCRWKKQPFWEYFDLVMPSIALAQGFGRIGCLLAGCCYGRQTTSKFGIVFHHSQFAPNNVRLIPTQIISSVGDFAIAGILLLYAKKKREDGKVAGLYLLLYSAGRFVIEFLRNDDRGAVAGLSTSQFIALFLFVIGAIIFACNPLAKNPKKNLVEDAIDEEENLEEIEEEEKASEEEIETVYLDHSKEEAVKEESGQEILENADTYAEEEIDSEESTEEDSEESVENVTPEESDEVTEDELTDQLGGSDVDQAN